MAEDKRNQQATLGCGTLILIALIVLIFSGRSGINSELHELRHELRKEIGALKASIEARPGDAIAPDKKASASAAAIAKDWRYPGVAIENIAVAVSPPKSDDFRLERYTVKAKFAEVWDHYAAKSGSTARFKDDVKNALMGEVKGMDKSIFLVLDISLGQESHFGQNSAKETIHVDIRRTGDEQTDICVLVGLR